MTRTRIIAAFLAVAVAAGAAAAYARWTSTVDGTGSARSQGLAGNAPTAVAAGSNVTVSWAAATFSDGTAATSYAVTRYNGASAAQATLADCAGSVTTLSCVERAVPAGTWLYAVTPKFANWVGTESVKSAPVVVAAATVDSAPPVTTAASTPTANGAGWHNADIAVSLQSTDAGTGVKQITFSTTGARVITTTTVTSSSATVPTITTAGTTTLSYFAEDLVGNVETTRTLTLRLDKTVPVTATLALPTRIRNGQSLSGTFADNAGGSGLASVSYYYCPSAAGSCTAGNGTLIGSSSSSPYSFTWASQPADGSYNVVANAVDLAGNAASNVATTTVDNTAITVSLLSIPNTGVSGKAERGDTIVVGFSEAPDLSTICTGWTGSTIGTGTNNDVTVTITDGDTSADSVAVTAGSCSGLNLGPIALGTGATGYVTGGGTARFRDQTSGNPSTITWDAATNRLTITLGTASTTGGATIGTVASPGTRATLSPASGIKDLAGNAITGTASNPAPAGTNAQQF